jgi:hypothetical protein
MITTALCLLVAASHAHSSSTPLGDGAGAMAPSLFGDGKHLHLTWLEPVDPTSGSGTWRLQHAKWQDGAWTSPTTVVTADDFFINWADTPVVCATDDAVLVTWLQMSGPGTYSYDIHAATSSDDGQTFSPIGRLHDDGVQAEHGFVSLAPDGDGIRAVWLDGREMGGGGGHGHDDHSADHGAMSLRTAIVTDTVSTSTVLDDRVCECCGTAVAVTNAGPIILYRDRSDDDRRDISVITRGDEEWTADATLHFDEWIIAACPVNGPAIDSHGDVAAAAWYTGTPSSPGVYASFLTDEHRAPSPPLIAGESAVGRVGITMTGPDAAIVTWIEATDGGGLINGRLLHADGSLGHVVTVANVSDSRQSGFPRTTIHDGHLVVAMTEPDRRNGIRVIHVPLASFLLKPSTPRSS